MTSWYSPASVPGAENCARTRRIWIAAGVSVFAHALLISGVAVGPGARRPVQTTQTLSVTLALVSIRVEESATATASQPESPTRESDSPRTEETPTPVPKRAASKTAAQSPQTVSAPGAQARIEQNARPRPPSPQPGDGVTHSPDTTYYTIRQLDIYPVPAEPLRLGSVTHGARRDARAIVELQISESGRVDAARVIEAHPRGDFENELTATFLAIRFTPAVRDGRVVRSRVLVRIE
jgi:TonB family protein